MKWRDVKEGMTVEVKGEPWSVVATDGGEVTLHHATMGERVGNPPPDGDVRVIEADRPKERVTLAEVDAAVKERRDDDPSDRERLREYAKSQGLSHAKTSDRTSNELRAMIADLHRDRVAEDNDVPARVVMDAELRLTLGATVIAELHEHSERPQTPMVGVMDRQTMRNHFHFFHDFYPDGGAKLERLLKIHEEEHEAGREAALHDHSVPF